MRTWPGSAATWPGPSGHAEETIARRLWHRLPWLFVGLGGATAAAIIVGGFEDQLDKKVRGRRGSGTRARRQLLDCHSCGHGLPWLFWRIGVDPAFGSGPLATVVQDLLSITVYLVIATAIVG